jgi:integrase
LGPNKPGKRVMGAIFKRKGIWYVDLRVGGKRLRKKAGKSKHLAGLLLNDLELKAERNQLGILDRKKVLIDDFVPEFIRYSHANHRSSTTSRYRSTLGHFQKYSREIGIKYLHEITPNIVEKYKIWRKTTAVARNGSDPSRVKAGSIRKGAKSYTVNFDLMTLKSMLHMAVKWRRLETSPAAGIKKLKPEDSKPRRFLTEAECKRLLASSDPYYYPIFFTFLNTGMRRGELVNLEWPDVDFEHGIINIRRKPFWMPKTGEREIPMNDELRLVLRRLPKRGNFVFTDERGYQLNPDTIRRALAETAEKGDISNLTELHSLRHTFASALNKQGVDLPSIQKLMGHRSIETTMIYTHQTTQQLRDAVARLKMTPNTSKRGVIQIA